MAKPFCTTLLTIIIIIFAVTAYTENIADISLSETEIHLKPVTGLMNISAELTDEANMPVLTKSIKPQGITIGLNEFGILYNGFYTIHLSAETGETKEVTVSNESGREPGTYHLKTIITQSEVFHIQDNKILIETIMEN